MEIGGPLSKEGTLMSSTISLLIILDLIKGHFNWINGPC